MTLALFTLGGTIASTGPGGEYVTATLSGAELLQNIPLAVTQGNRVVVEEFGQRPSGDYTLDEIVALATRIDALDDTFRGVVVTMGTDTLEEVAYALDLLVATTRPIVVTGAMRHPQHPGADGPANLHHALCVAAAPGAGERGVLVVMADEVHLAREVTKTHATSPSSFRSLNTGPRGEIIEGRVHFYDSPTAQLTSALRVTKPVPPVALIKFSLGDDDRLVSQVTQLGYAGLVVEGFGAGHVPERCVASLEMIAREIPVVLASRTSAGSTLTHTYGYPGSESDLLTRGLVGAGHLSGVKARLALALILGSNVDSNEVGRAFAKLNQGDPT